ncbi:hypothetical protein BDP27DRAFT_1368461 [Rhodocollybia butyracea]|uniref:Uncharacterized protein n=1 Tax=Rhodocollybia butyracea TaxID=206335 RepID=A0A9P5PHU0_9AGAR|nr:hypothetical protein BDP27DRAFT_1368461 [Rhodocollybia butyracea]
MSDMPSDTDTLFMLAYASAVKTEFQLDVGENYCMLIKITNYLIYKFADALQYSDNPSYTGGSAGSYIQQLHSYIDWVDLKRDPSPQATNIVQGLADTLTLANNQYWSVIEDGLNIFNKFKELYPGQDFWQWAHTAYVPIGAAHKVLKFAQTRLYQAMQNYYGPDYGLFSTYMDRITNAQSSNALPGYNQDGIADDNLIEGAIESANGRQVFPEPTQSTIRVPMYSIASYTNTVQAWITASEQGATRDKIIATDIEQARKVDWTHFGFPQVHPTLRGSAPAWRFFSAEVNTTDGQSNSRTLDIDGLENYVSLQLAMMGAAKFDIQPANVKFGSEIKDKVDQIINEVRTTGGSMSIFGFHVAVNGSGAGAGGGAVGNSTKRVDAKFEDIQWDNETGSLRLPPTKGQVYPTILAVIAQRFQAG